MRTVYLNPRCKKIIQRFLQSDSYLSLQDLTTELKVSRRSIYYDFCKINEWLEENQIPELPIVRGKGIYLEKNIREKISACLDEKAPEDMHIYSPMERVRIIICAIIYSSNPVYIDNLTEYCGVSRNTVFNDLRVVTNQLQEYDLMLEYESRNGYSIAGDPIKERAVFLMNLKELQHQCSKGMLTFVDREKFSYHQNVLKEIEKELGVEYIAENRDALALLLPIMERGNENLHFANLKEQEIQNRREYKIVEAHFPDFIEKEKIYLCLHLLGGRIANCSEEFFDNDADQTVYEISKALVAEFEKTACVVFDDRETLERQLFMHINSSMYRYQYGIQYIEPINEDIIREYPDLFEISKIVSRYLEKLVGFPISDAETAYLALHFGAHLPISYSKEKSSRILIVCVNGISTANMLKREILKLLPGVQIVGVQSAAQIQNAQEICDLIVSTIKLKSVVPVIQVQPILTSRDKEVLLRHIKLKGTEELLNANELFAAIKPYIPEKNHKVVLEKIEEYLFYGPRKKSFEEKKKALLDILTPERIEVHDGKHNWTQALWLAADFLIKNGSIETGYVENIIHQLRYYGPYMFITPRVVLAHTKLEAGSNALDCTIHIFKDAVEFSETNRANVVIMLGIENHESHLKALRDIVLIFQEDSHVDAILGKDDGSEVLQYIREQLEADSEK